MNIYFAASMSLDDMVFLCRLFYFARTVWYPILSITSRSYVSGFMSSKLRTNDKYLLHNDVSLSYIYIDISWKVLQRNQCNTWPIYLKSLITKHFWEIIDFSMLDNDAVEVNNDSAKEMCDNLNPDDLIFPESVTDWYISTALVTVIP